MSLIPQTTLASQLDPWPFRDNFLPSLFETSSILNVENALNSCRLADGTLLKDCEASTNFGKAYRYWIKSPSNMDEWAQLGCDAPNEVEILGRYLITIQRLNADATFESNPEWMKRNPGICKKIAAVLFVAGIIGLFTAGIFLIIKYQKNKG